jgi:hypothetical protein
VKHDPHPPADFGLPLNSQIIPSVPAELAPAAKVSPPDMNDPPQPAENGGEWHTMKTEFNTPAPAGPKFVSTSVNA